MAFKRRSPGDAILALAVRQNVECLIERTTAYTARSMLG
jgi:hypothetical protein